MEANETLGGRLQSVKIGENSYDLGGQWILPEHKALMQIVDKLGLRTVLPPNPGKPLKKVIQVGRKGRLRTTLANPDPVVLPKRLGRHTGIRAWLAHLELTYIVWKLDRLAYYIQDLTDPYHSESLSEELAHELDSITVDAYLKQHIRFKSVQDVIEIHLRLLTGADLNQITVLWLLSYAKWQGCKSFYDFLHNVPSNQEMENLPPICIKNGAQQICEQLVQQCIGTENVYLNQPVANVTYLSDGTGGRNVYVTTKNGHTYSCFRAIMALPPNILREVDFTPSLEPTKKYILASMVMGSTMKFIITYSDSFWSEANFSGDFMSFASPITWLADASYQNGTPTLVGFLAGHQAVEASKLSLEDFKSTVLDKLSTIFGSKALEPTSFEVKNWMEEKFIGGGTVCHPGSGAMINYASIRTPHGPIHFAGTETAIKYMGTMAGAVQAGQRAALEVLDNLRPQSLSAQDYLILKESQSKFYQQGKRKTQDFSVYKWTLVLPSVAIVIAWTAIKLRNTYGHLVVPM